LHISFTSEQRDESDGYQVTTELDLETIAEVANDNNLPPSDAVSTVNGVDEEEDEQVWQEYFLTYQQTDKLY